MGREQGMRLGVRGAITSLWRKSCFNTGTDTKTHTRAHRQTHRHTHTHTDTHTDTKRHTRAQTQADVHLTKPPSAAPRLFVTSALALPSRWSWLNLRSSMRDMGLLHVLTSAVG